MAQVKTSKDIPASTLTRMQELGSAWVFKRAIQDNKRWKDWEAIRDDPKTFNEIEKIWDKVGRVKWNDRVDNEWLQSFYKQQGALINEIGRPAFTEFTRDGNIKGGPKYILPGSNRGETFMEWVEDWIGTEFKIGTKDNWNPADIWLIRNEKKWKEKIKEATRITGQKNKTTIRAQLNQFNAIFKQLFITKQVIGLSLKKIGNYPAEFKAVNVTQRYFKKLDKTLKVRKNPF